jgi:hypothetical protein
MGGCSVSDRSFKDRAAPGIRSFARVSVPAVAHRERSFADFAKTGVPVLADDRAAVSTARCRCCT